MLIGQHFRIQSYSAFTVDMLKLNLLSVNNICTKLLFIRSLVFLKFFLHFRFDITQFGRGTFDFLIWFWILLAFLLCIKVMVVIFLSICYSKQWFSKHQRSPLDKNLFRWTLLIIFVLGRHSFINVWELLIKQKLFFTTTFNDLPHGYAF